MELGQVRAGSDEFLTLFSVKWGQGTCSEGEAGAGVQGPRERGGAAFGVGRANAQRTVLGFPGSVLAHSYLFRYWQICPRIIPVRCLCVSVQPHSAIWLRF